MSTTPIDENTLNGNGDDEVNQSSTWVDSFVKLDHLFGGSLFNLFHRIIDIVLLSVGLYHGIITCTVFNFLNIVSLCLFILSGIDIGIVFLFVVLNYISLHGTSSNEERLLRYKRAIRERRCFRFLKFVKIFVGIGYVFQKSIPNNTLCEPVRFYLGIICFSAWAQMFMARGKPALPIRRSVVLEYSTALLTLIFNSFYFGFLVFAMSKTLDPLCTYTNMEDLHLRAPLKSFAYVGLILIVCRTLINVLIVPVNSLYFRLLSWRRGVVRLLGMHYALSHLISLSFFYYLSIGAVLLFQPRSGGSCGLAASDLYKTLLIWEWIYILLPLAMLPLILLLRCVGFTFGSLLASCLPASISVPLLEMFREWTPEEIEDVIPDARAPDNTTLPAAPSTIDAVPLVVFGQEADQFNQTECAICQSDFEINEQIKRLRCGHFFHTACVTNWLLITSICPLCRRRTVSDN